MASSDALTPNAVFLARVAPHLTLIDPQTPIGTRLVNQLNDLRCACGWGSDHAHTVLTPILTN
jgi:hypothetical protein